MAKNQSTTGITVEKPKAAKAKTQTEGYLEVIAKTSKNGSKGPTPQESAANFAAVLPKTTGTITKKAVTPQVPAIKGVTPLGKKVTEVKHPTPAELASSSAAAPVKKLPKEKKMGEPDVYGFGRNSQISFLILAIGTGKYTRDDLKKVFADKFATGEENTDKGRARKISSMGVFFSDVKKPFTTYPASRSMILIEDPKTKKLSWDAKRADRVRESIGQGLLKELRGLNGERQPGKVNVILKKYGLPLREVTKEVKE